MDYTQSFAISAAGMNIERMRVDVAALNLANANTVQGVGGTSYQPLRVVAEARSAVGDLAGGTSGGFGALVSQGLGSDAASQGAPLARIVPANVAPRLVYEPGHPLANERTLIADLERGHLLEGDAAVVLELEVAGDVACGHCGDRAEGVLRVGAHLDRPGVLRSRRGQAQRRQQGGDGNRQAGGPEGLQGGPVTGLTGGLSLGGIH